MDFEDADAHGVAQRTFPDVELHTRRVRLRAYRTEDTEDHVRMFRSEPVRRWSTEPQPYPYSRGRAWCALRARAAREEGIGINWAAVDRETGQYLAMVAVNHTNWKAKVAEVAAIAAPWATGRGLATETLRAVSEWVLVDQRFNRLQITTAVGNRAARLVAATCGFVQEGVLRNAGYTHHGQVDLIVHGLTAVDLDRAGVRPDVIAAVR